MTTHAPQGDSRGMQTKRPAIAWEYPPARKQAVTDLDVGAPGDAARANRPIGVGQRDPLPVTPRKSHRLQRPEAARQKQVWFGVGKVRAVSRCRVQQTAAPFTHRRVILPKRTDGVALAGAKLGLPAGATRHRGADVDNVDVILRQSIAREVAGSVDRRCWR